MEGAWVTVHFSTIAGYKVALIFGIHSGVTELTGEGNGVFNINRFIAAKTRVDYSVKIAWKDKTNKDPKSKSLKKKKSHLAT